MRRRVVAAASEAAVGAPTRWCPQFTPVLTSVTIPDGVRSAFETNRASEIAVQTKENEVAQRAAEADAIRKLNEALAAAGDNYVLLKAIERCKVTFWVLPNGQQVNLPLAPP